MRSRNALRARSGLAIATLVLGLSILGPSAGAVTTQWVAAFGMNDGSGALAVAHDDSGVYVVGSGDGDFPDDVPTLSGHPAYIRKYDFDGQVLWSREFGTGQYNNAADVSTVPGGVLVAGVLHGSRYGGGVGFVRKFDPAGNILWTRTIGGGEHSIDVTAMSLVSDAIYVVGSTDGTFPGQHSVGAKSEFLQKMELDGTKRWVREFGGAEGGSASDVFATTRAVYVTGDVFTANESRAEIRRFDPKGQLRWRRSLHTEHATSITARGGAVYVGSTTYSPRYQRSTGHLQRFDTAGNGVWSRTVPRFVPDVETAPGVVYATGGALRAFDPADGTGLWSYASDAFSFEPRIEAIDLADHAAYVCGSGKVAGDPIENDDSYVSAIQLP
jgi:hypothetical protein